MSIPIFDLKRATALLADLDQANRRRREIATCYREALAGVDGVEVLHDPEGTEPVYHQFTLLADRRDALREHLAAGGIGSAVFYPIPLHRQPALARFVPAGLELPVAERASLRALSLPMFPELEDHEVTAVRGSLARFFGRA
jgi:dTDP-4-amino-4,6-dideoxygalactose transaminase